jgi:hypothetical protein
MLLVHAIRSAAHYMIKPPTKKRLDAVLGRRHSLVGAVSASKTKNQETYRVPSNFQILPHQE